MIGLLFMAGVLGALQNADGRVAEIAWRLQTANAALCREVVPLPGFSVQTLDQFSPSVRAAAAAELRIGALPQISAVVPGSAASRAGFRVGDAIKAINGVAMPRARGGAPSYDATAVVEATLAGALARPPARLELDSRTVVFSGDAGCASQVQLVPEARLDARADGRYVQISGTMYEFASKDAELAFIIAHELAHNIFPQAARVGAGGARQRAAELAADELAVWMVARAGYDLTKMDIFLERLRDRRPLSWLDGSHPRWTDRIATVIAAIAAVKQDQAAGRPLIPPTIMEGTRGSAER